MSEPGPNGNDATITTCVIARDEAENLAELLPQLRWADEVLVLVDDSTTDESAAIAKPLADRVEELPFGSFSAFRNRALDLAGCTWIFFVDADERVSPEVAEEVRSTVAESESRPTQKHRPSEDTDEEHAPVAYWIPRHNIMFGRLIQGGGWSPDYQLRLIRRGAGRYDESRLVHETPSVDGPTDYLSRPLLHFNYDSLSEFLAKQRRYTRMEADAMRADSIRPRRRALVGTPIREFGRRFFRESGWVDGPVGLFLCSTMAFCAFQRVRLARANR
jgi:glycosyltransferase involved in cell wall biosynthesis